jgi:DNA polymerase-3 subunit delta
LLKLDVSSLAGDPGRLLDEVNSIGLFGGERLIWVQGAANEKALVEALQVIAEQRLVSSYVVVEAGDLKKGAALRKIGESAKSVAVACYADDARALNGLIDSELAKESIRITPAAREVLLELIGGDRIASRNEIQKLLLYCRGLDTIDEKHVVDIIGDASAISTDDAVDAILRGDTEAFLNALRKITSSKTPIFLVLQGCLRQFQMLDVMRLEMDEKKLQPAQVMQTHGRHLHFKRKPVIENALRVWTSSAIARETNRLQAAIFQSRRTGSLEASIAMQTLLATTLQSGRKPG